MLPPTRVFLEKRLQAIEDKRTECEKNARRGGKLLRTKELREKVRHGEHCGRVIWMLRQKTIGQRR
jgi:hypothetical protein